MNNARMGLELGFIESIKLVDGREVKNMQVLYNAPIPSAEELEEILKGAKKTSTATLGEPKAEWSQYGALPQDRTKTSTTEVTDSLFNARVENEYAQALIDTLSDAWEDICSVRENYDSSIEKAEVTYHEVMRLSSRIETLLNLTREHTEATKTEIGKSEDLLKRVKSNDE